MLLLIILFTEAGSACNDKCQICDKTVNTCTGCKSGWYGRDCMFHCQNCLGGCNGSGICHQCTPGRYGQYCQLPCPAYCDDNGYGKVYCRREDGECQEGCHTGRWGDTCYRPCNQHCDDRGCLQQNGHCIGNCQVGWWGLKCDRKCPHSCKGGCGSMNGKCLDGCKDGFTSIFCNETCPDSCMECHQYSGKCVKCSALLYGSDCDKECGSNCVSYLCNMQGRCIDGCNEGFTGPTCNEVCPVNCISCKQDDVICTNCKVGWAGERRDTSDPEIFEETPVGTEGIRSYAGGSACNDKCQICDKTVNTCTGCKSGWYGRDCMFHCQNCLGGCNGSGICHQCTPGRYGQYCQLPCPAYCDDNGYGKVYCRREDGECQKGCHTGRWGDTCYRPCNQHCDDRGCLQQNGHCIGNCQVGWWGLKCDRKCPHGCRGGCGSMNGKCLDGCKDGFTSIFCNETCPDSCMECHQHSGKCVKCSALLYGSDCDKECGSNCVSYLCNMQGRCIDGCNEGFMGPTCNEVCPVNCISCKQDDVICTNCKVGWAGERCDTSDPEIFEETPVGTEGIRSYAGAPTGNARKHYLTMSTFLLLLAVAILLREDVGN